eukprot:m.184475 g.184475  ORF g.184475 m.184475 type:complete len:116 (+) comp39321_c0_seq2:166-513(+)
MKAFCLRRGCEWKVPREMMDALDELRSEEAVWTSEAAAFSGVLLPGKTPWPAMQDFVCLFVAALAEEGLAATTIKGYLAEVRNLLGHTDRGFSKILELVMRGVVRAAIELKKAER